MITDITVIRRYKRIILITPLILIMRTYNNAYICVSTWYVNW